MWRKLINAKLLMVREHRQHSYWTQLIWDMAHEDKTQFDSLKGTEVNEFFYLLKAFRKNIELRKELNKSKNRR